MFLELSTRKCLGDWFGRLMVGQNHAKGFNVRDRSDEPPSYIIQEREVWFTDPSSMRLQRWRTVASSSSSRCSSRMKIRGKRTGGPDGGRIGSFLFKPVYIQQKQCQWELRRERGSPLGAPLVAPGHCMSLWNKLSRSVKNWIDPLVDNGRQASRWYRISAFSTEVLNLKTPSTSIKVF